MNFKKNNQSNFRMINFENGIFDKGLKKYSVKRITKTIVVTVLKFIAKEMKMKICTKKYKKK